MSEARDQFAKRLHGRRYREEMTVAEEVEARDARLLVVFGASDDLTEFRGILYDEEGAHNGTVHTIILGLTGELVLHKLDDDQDLPQKGVTVRAEWLPKTIDGSWLITPSVSFASFDIMEDGKLYCRVAVIDEADLLPVQRVLGVGRDAENPKVLLVSFSATLTDDDLRGVHDHLRGWCRYG